MHLLGLDPVCALRLYLLYHGDSVAVQPYIEHLAAME